MREYLTQTIEDYLKTIFEITEPYQRVSTNQIADALGVSAASVTGMLRKLSQTNPPLVEYQKHHGAVLTAAGEQVALEILRHHRLLEMYLDQILGYNWDEVHQEQTVWNMSFPKISKRASTRFWATLPMTRTVTLSLTQT